MQPGIPGAGLVETGPFCHKKLSEKRNNSNTAQPNNTGTALHNNTGNNSDETVFVKNGAIPPKLAFSQLKETSLTLNETKMIKAEFVSLNNKILNDLQSKVLQSLICLRKPESRFLI